MRGFYSYGLVMNFSDLYSYKLDINKFNKDDDLTDIIGVKHYQKELEKPKETRERKKGLKGWFYCYLIKLIELFSGPINAMAPWPKLMPRTDEPQHAHLKGIIASKYEGEVGYSRIKMHGQSLTCFYYNGRTGVCSRNYELISSASNNKNPILKK